MEAKTPAVWIVREEEGCLAFSSREKAERFMEEHKKAFPDVGQWLEECVVDDYDGLEAQVCHSCSVGEDGVHEDSWATMTHPDEMEEFVTDPVHSLKQGRVTAISFESAEKAREMAEAARKERIGEGEAVKAQ